MYYSLVDVEGSPRSVMGYVNKCMKKEAFTRYAIEQYLKRCSNGNYTYLICESLKMIALCNEHRKRVKEKHQE